MSADSHIKIEFDHAIELTAMPTGRKDDRGRIVIRVSDSEQDAQAWLSPAEAKRLAAVLTDVAERAATFSTRGFVGSDE